MRTHDFSVLVQKKWERIVRRSHLKVSSAIAYQCGVVAGIRQRHNQFCVRMIELLFMIVYHTKAERKSQACYGKK